MVRGLFIPIFLAMKRRSTSVAVDEEGTDLQVSESHFQLIKYRMDTEYYDNDAVRKNLAQAISLIM